MSLKNKIEKEINNPPIIHTDSKNPYIELKSTVDNLKNIILEMAGEIDKMDSKINRYMGG